MVYACCVRGCKTVATNGLHSFPANKVQAKKWILAIKAFDLIDYLDENKLSRSYRKVCKNHFRDCEFIPNIDGKSRLVPNSIPSVSLPPGETVAVNN